MRKQKTVLQKAKHSKGASAQSKQIQTLARQVDNLKETTRELSIPTYYSLSYSTNTDAYPLIIPLTSGPSTTSPAESNNTPVDSLVWNKRFNYGGPTPNETRQNLKLYSQYVDVILEPGSEEDLLIHTIFLVKLRNDENQARDTYNSTTQMRGMTFGDDYISNQERPGAQAWMNPEKYEIHKRWEFHTCGEVESVPGLPGAAGTIQNKSGAINRFGFKINYSGRHLRAIGTGKELSDVVYDDIEPDNKYFLVAFSDNSILDLQNPKISVSSIIKARMF